MFPIPVALQWLEASASGREWLQQLPDRVAVCVNRWRLTLEPPYEQSYLSIVFPAVLLDGLRAVLKIQYPHMESEHEAEALRCWTGDGAVRLLDHAPEHHALLLERCEPGDHLSVIHADEALEVFAQLLPKLWINAGKPFRTLYDEAAGWLKDLPLSWERTGRPFEAALLETALEALEQLRSTQGEQVLLHQDLHGDNILRAQRMPWLVIDPKPLAGEKELSLAPIIRGYEFGHSRAAVIHRLDTLSAMLRVNRERARLWALGQTLAWCFGSVVYGKHIETARWLWEAG